MVRAYMIFGGVGPMLVVTQLTSGMQGAVASKHLVSKGITKFIAFEVSVHKVKEIYGPRYGAAVERLVSDSDIRVVDMDGHNVFGNFDFIEMGEPVYVGGGAY